MCETAPPPRLERTIQLAVRSGTVTMPAITGDRLLTVIRSAVSTMGGIEAHTSIHYVDDEAFTTVEFRSYATAEAGSGEPTVYYLAEEENPEYLRITPREFYRTVRLVMRGVRSDDEELLQPWREAKELAKCIMQAIRQPA